MLEKLFNSKIRANLLALFFRNQGKELYPQEIINMLGSDPANTHRELKFLEGLALVNKNKIKGKNYYRINKENEYFDGLNRLLEKYAKIEDGGEIAVLEEMPDYTPSAVIAAWNVKAANGLFKELGIKNRFSKLLTIYENNSTSLCVIKKEFNQLSRELIHELIQNPKMGYGYLNKIVIEHKKLFKATEKYLNTNLADLSKKELYEIYNEYFTVYQDNHRLHWVQTVSDFGDNLLSKYLIKYLKNNIKDKKYSVGDIFSILTTPAEDSYAAKEYKELLKILNKIINVKDAKGFFAKTDIRIIEEKLHFLYPEIDKMLSEHTKKWGWLGFGFVGPAWGKDYFIDILCSFIRQEADPDMLLEGHKKDKEKLKEKQEKYIKCFIKDENHKDLFAISRGLIHSKAIRKDAMFYYFYALHNFLQEIANRYYLSINQARYIYHHEFKDILLKEKLDVETLNQRYKSSIHYSTGHFKDDLYLYGKEAEKFKKRLKFIKENTDNVKFLAGDCASSGRVRGKVSIVNNIEDMENISEGDVLVSVATNPNLVPAIKKASAIVTDMGGITSHAAIISRELGIPCVIGTKISTKALKNGDLVDVDATHGKVLIIKKK